MTYDRKRSTMPVRIADTINFRQADMSALGPTIWTDYFKTIFSDNPAKSLGAPVGTKNPDFVEGGNKDAIKRYSERGLEKFNIDTKKAGVNFGDYRNKFVTDQQFSGYITEKNGNKFLAILHNLRDDKFEYGFSPEELPPKQRLGASVGAKLSVLVGFEYKGATKVKSIRLNIVSDIDYDRFKNELITKRSEMWKF